jgi:uncharacterized protein (UPF0335 family)
LVKDVVREYVQKLKAIENEKELLREDRKNLDHEYKEKIDIKAVKAALRIIKIRADGNEDLIDSVMSIMGSVEGS